MKQTAIRTERAVARFLDRWRTKEPADEARMTKWLGAVTLAVFVVSVTHYDIFPVSAFLVPIIIAGLFLGVRHFVMVAGFASLLGAVSVITQVARSGIAEGRFGAWMVMNVVAGLFLFYALRRRSGLPAAASDSMLMDLRDRLWDTVDAEHMPDDWQVHEKIASAGGAQFAGDFMVAHRRDDVLDLILVDVCGKGVAAGTRALQFSGALNGLVGSLPPLGLMSAANDYLLRQDWLDGFATAVHIEISLETGDFTILNAGHPPVLWWCAATREWLPDVATGLALGIEARPDFSPTRGHLEPGDALLAVTDGIVETHEHDVTEGIEWLKEVASEAISPGFDGAPERIIAKVAEANDDRAVVLIHRLPKPVEA